MTGRRLQVVLLVDASLTSNGSRHETPSLMVPVARASALINALSAVVIVVWLIAGELDIGTLGTVLLIAAAAFSVAFTVLYLMASIRPGGYGPEPPAAPG